MDTREQSQLLFLGFTLLFWGNEPLIDLDFSKQKWPVGQWFPELFVSVLLQLDSLAAMLLSWIGVFSIRLWVFDTSHELVCKCTGKTELQPQNDTCIEVSGLTIPIRAQDILPDIKLYFLIIKKMYLQVATSCFPKMIWSFPTYTLSPSFLISSANGKSMIQEKMEVRRKLWAFWDSRGWLKEGQEGGETPGPHAITNSSKIYWHQSLDLVK